MADDMIGIGLQNIVLFISIVGSIVILERFVFNKGKKEAEKQAWREKIEHDIKDVNEKIDNQAVAASQLKRDNQADHNALTAKVNKLEKMIVHILTKIDPKYKPDKNGR